VSAHPIVPLVAPDGRDVDIDVEIVDLVEQAWALGCRTAWSCQNHGEAMAVHDWSPDHLLARRRRYLGYAVIDFVTPDDLMAFLTAVARGGPRDDFYLRMVHSMAPDAWETAVTLWDRAVSADEAGRPPGSADFVVRSGRVFLPARDVEEATDRICRYLDGHREPPVTIDWDRVGW